MNLARNFELNAFKTHFYQSYDNTDLIDFTTTYNYADVESVFANHSYCLEFKVTSLHV